MATNPLLLFHSNRVAAPYRSSIQNAFCRVFLVVILASACSTPIAEQRFRGDGASARSVFVINHGWHSAILIKRADIPATVLPEVRDFPDAEYLEFGWGDRDYYQAPDPGLILALKAAFWSSGSVLHVAGFKGSVESFFRGSEIVELVLSDDAFRRLINFISDTFSRSRAAEPAEARPGLYAGGRFYPATGSFHVFRTCNTWMAEALRAAGLPVSPAFAFTAGNLMNQVNQFGAVR